MAGKAKPFSKQTQRYLRTLPAVDAVTATRIYYTDEFRREVMRRYDAGIVLAPSSVRMGSIPKSLDTNVSNAPLPDGRMVRPHFISPTTTMPISTIRVTRSSFSQALRIVQLEQHVRELKQRVRELKRHKRTSDSEQSSHGREQSRADEEEHL